MTDVVDAKDLGSIGRFDITVGKVSRDGIEAEFLRTSATLPNGEPYVMSVVFSPDCTHAQVIAGIVDHLLSVERSLIRYEEGETG